MSGLNAPLLSLNAGTVSKLALARVDLAKMRLAMEVQTNLLPKVMGPAEFRPGTEYLTSTRDNQPARLIPFVYNTATTADIELTPNRMRILLDDGPLTRPAVSAVITNPDFPADLSGWTSIDETGASSFWGGFGRMDLLGTGFNYAGRRQEVATSNAGTEHSLRILIGRGPVVLRIGSAAGYDDLLAETSLSAGWHSIAFTPTGGSFWVDVRGLEESARVVNFIQIESAVTVEIETPWGTNDIANVRYDQSSDVLFCAAGGHRQQRIERRSQRSWSIVGYLTDDGPFLSPNLTATTMTADSTFGIVTVTSSRPVFTTGHVGSLLRMTTAGQSASANLAGAEQWSDAIRVTGVSSDGSNSRSIGVAVTGTWAGTVKLQRSLAEPGAWTDVASYATNQGLFYDDELDNQIVYYRVGFPSGGYTSGVASVALTYGSGVQTGIVRIDAVNSTTSVSGYFLRPISSASAATVDWAEGSWSEGRGWPTSVAFHDGRLWWFRRGMTYGSVSDAYHSFDADLAGDAGPIQRSIATGGNEGINWALSLQRLLVGTAAQEVSIRSSSFDEPLTPTAFTARSCSTRGSANLAAVEVDTAGIFVQRDGKHVFELAYDVQGQDYASANLTRINEDICAPGVVDIAVQRQPDTRIWFVLANGDCAVLTRERADEVAAWTLVTSTHGAFEAVSVTPGQDQDDVKFVVRRVIGGVTKRYIERLRGAGECIGGTLSRNLDCHVTYSGAPTTVIPGLSHLEGQAVAVWGDGRTIVSGRSTVAVSGGSVTLPAAVSNAVVGIPYAWRLKTTKLAYGARQGSTPLLQRKRVDHVGFVAQHFGWKGTRIGRDFDTMRDLSSILDGRTLSPDETIEDYDYDATSFPGGWSTDARVCVEGVSPYPATILGMVIGMNANERGLGGNPRPSGEGG
ncbi:hypothetical protein [Enterovirga sp. CN4-39]|uniref:hypothetical protein n=1 Tax=Enterovirga sp. CN4-39 TaxID=3400910 RepID=UPI003C11845E